MVKLNIIIVLIAIPIGVMCMKKSNLCLHSSKQLKEIIEVDETLPDPETYPKDYYLKPKVFGLPKSDLNLYPEKDPLQLYQELFTKHRMHIPSVGYKTFWHRTLKAVKHRELYDK
jgi:hypothetical protein